MTPRRAARVDRNQPEIVAELRERDYIVVHLHTLGKGVPDILVGGPHFLTGQCEWLLVEIKSSDSAELTEQEAEFWQTCKDANLPMVVATDFGHVLHWFGWEYGPNEEKGVFEWQHP